MMARLLKPAAVVLLVGGLLAPTLALCLPAPRRHSCCPERCADAKAASQQSACCRPAVPARLEERIFRVEVPGLTAVSPSVALHEPSASSVSPVALIRPAQAPPQASSGLSPPRLA